MDEIHGVRLRPYAGSVDHASMAGIVGRHWARLGVDPLSTLGFPPTAEGVASSLEEVRKARDDVVLAEVDGAVRGFATARAWVEADGVTVCLHAEFADFEPAACDVASVLVDWGEKRARMFAASGASASRAVLAANGCSTDTERTAALLSRGYSPVFSQTEMVRRSAELPVITEPSAGATITTAASCNPRTLWDLVSAAYAGREWTAVATEADFSRYVSGQLDPSLSRAAWLDGEIVGLVQGEVSDGRALIEEVVVHPVHRRRGLAAALLGRVLVEFESRGHDVVRLHTSGENVAGAMSLYEKFGFVATEKHVRYRRSL